MTDRFSNLPWIKDTRSSRIGLHNTGGLSIESGSAKDSRILEMMKKYKFDGMCIPEVNVNWNAVQNKDSMWERTYDWFEKRSIAVGFNQNRDTMYGNEATRKRPRTPMEPREQRYVRGGEVIIWKDEVAHRSCKKGSDPSKLGRWTWTVLEGKGGVKTRVVFVYCPVRNTLDRHINNRDDSSWHATKIGNHERLSSRTWIRK